MALITCNNITAAYDSTPVLSDIDFTVENGDYLCVIGENGSGKSTLIKVLLGLIKPKKGSVVYGDGLSAAQIGYLPQMSDIQRDFPASVFEVVLSGTLGKCGILPFYSAENKKTTLSNMELLGITELKNKCYNELSGGQQQRVLLARALCASEKILLLDEPTAGLDPKVTNELYSLINKLNKEQNITVIMITHDIKSAVTYSNKILHLAHKQLFFGTVDDYVKNAVSDIFKAGEKQ